MQSNKIVNTNIKHINHKLPDHIMILPIEIVEMFAPIGIQVWREENLANISFFSAFFSRCFKKVDLNREKFM